MSADAARNDACREYQSSLEDLTFNSKPHINMLTILAEENLQFAEDIVTIIEAQIAKAPAAEKLPVLYLVDSIVKNVGGQYLQVFAKNLITSFICVFEKVDENIRKSLYKLRSTWDEIFPPKKLYALDVRVNSVDPAWPIKPLPPNVNASIHVNPKFLKPTEEVNLQPPVSEKNLAEEQIIRQQLLAKQKQLLELQQKKIELELEQTKAQLAASSNPSPQRGPSQFDPPAVCQPAPTQNKSWHPTQADKPPNRDPRLNRAPTLSVNTKDQGAFRKESQVTQAVANAPEKRPHVPLERPSKLMRIPKKDTSAADEKAKSKSVSPLSKGVLHKSKDSRPEPPKTVDTNKKDPRSRKQMHEKTDLKDEDVKEKKKSAERKEREEVGKGPEPQRSSNSRSKLANGSLNKHDRFDAFPKQDIKVSKSNIRKRSRSRSRSPPQHSPKRKERRSPKRRTRSISPPLKLGKPRPLSKHNDGDNQHANAREDRNTPKKNVSEVRRLKRPLEDRTTEHRDVQAQRASPVDHKSVKDMKRWRSGWEENKPLTVKQPDPDLPLGKHGLQRHKGWNSYQRPPTPRTPKPHRLSVDANLQIPDVLHSASKRDILRKASQRYADGELTQEEFLNVAHQINQLIQYQEVKQRSDTWDGPNNEGGTCQRKQAQGLISDAERSYLEHKSKLRRTQLQCPGNQSSPSKEIMQYNRPQHEHDDLAFKPSSGPNDPRRNDRLTSQTGLPFRNSPSPAGCDANTVKSSLPFEESAQSMDMDQLEDGDISPRFESPNSVHSDTGPDSDAPLVLEPSSRHEVVLGPGRGGLNLNESPGQTPPHSSEGPKTQVNMPRHDGVTVPARFDGHMSSHAQFEGAHGLTGQTRPEGPSRPNPSGRYEVNSGPGRYDSPGAHGPVRFDVRYDGPGPHRFERPPLLKGPGRYDNQSAPHRPMRFTEPRFEGQIGSNRFDGPIAHQGPGRFEGPGPMRYNGPIHSNRFDGPARFDNPHMPQGPPGGFEGPVRYPSGLGYEGHRRLEGPGSQSGMMRFDNPAQQTPIRFEGLPSGIQRFDSAQQGPPRYCGPPNMQNSCRPQGQMIIDQSQNQGPILNSGIPTHNFNMGAFDGQALPFHMQQNVSQGATFNMQEPTSSGFQNPYRPVTPFPGAAPPNPTQSMPIISGPLQNFGQPNPAPFNTAGSQFAQPESHLGQMDVNDLMSKLIDFGIIKPTPTDSSSESTSVAPSQSVPEEEEPEEEEEEQEEDDTLPDMTGFVVEDMKQRHESVIIKLYTGIQCYSCGMRFTASQTDIYADHLDWHYRQNRSEKDISRKITHRRWYYSLTDWIEFEEIADLEERAKSQFFEKVHEEVVQKNQEAAKEREFQSVKAAADVVHECCEICQEQFEMYWEEDEEEWHLKNAIRVDEKTYHPLCYEDYRNTSSFVDSTPSPNKMLTENPLNAFLKQESEGEVSCSSIKEEPSDRDLKAVTVKLEAPDETEGGSQTTSAISF